MKTKGIKTVLATMLMVALFGATSCESGTTNSRSSGERWDDNRIEHNVRSELKRSALTKDADIKVSSYRGNVILTGFVDDPVQKQVASDLAKSTGGMKSLQNNLAVKSSLPNRGRVSNEAAGAQSKH